MLAHRKYDFGINVWWYENKIEKCASARCGRDVHDSSRNWPIEPDSGMAEICGLGGFDGSRLEAMAGNEGFGDTLK